MKNGKEKLNVSPPMFRLSLNLYPQYLYFSYCSAVSCYYYYSKLLHQANLYLVTSDSPWDCVRGITYKPGFSTKFDTAPPWVLSNRPANYEVDQLNSWEDVFITYRET